MEAPALPSSAEFLERLVGTDGRRGLSPEEQEEVEAALASDEPPLESAGHDEAAKVLSHFCRRQGGDARTLRMIVDNLLRLTPQFAPLDLFACLAAFVPRFAPVALVLEAGHALVRLCQLFEQLLLFHDPEVAFLLHRAKVGAEIYCAPWLLTAHAAGLADGDAILQVWAGWLAQGESLDPIFLGLARLTICHEELVQCGPVPELAQLLQTSLGSRDHARPRVVSAALQRAAQLKSMTPLTFLRQLQDALLRPPSSEPVPAPALPEEPATPRRALAHHAAKASWLPPAWRQKAAEALKAAEVARPSTAGKKAMPVCMCVEPQDVMMMETVKARIKGQAAQGPEEDTGCRLYPKLIDIRLPGESRSYGVRNAVFVDVRDKQNVKDFLTWATKREASVVAKYGLRPMHVMLTSSGAVSADQSTFLQIVLQRGIPCVCVLQGGYEGLRPFFVVEAGDGGVALAERAQQAQELLQKGVGNLQALWQKAPNRQQIMERVAQQNRPVQAAPATFERAPEQVALGKAPVQTTFDRAPEPAVLPELPDTPPAAMSASVGVPVDVVDSPKEAKVCVGEAAASSPSAEADSAGQEVASRDAAAPVEEAAALEEAECAPRDDAVRSAAPVAAASLAEECAAAESSAGQDAAVASGDAATAVESLPAACGSAAPVAAVSLEEECAAAESSPQEDAAPLADASQEKAECGAAETVNREEDAAAAPVADASLEEDVAREDAVPREDPSSPEPRAEDGAASEQPS